MRWRHSLLTLVLLALEVLSLSSAIAASERGNSDVLDLAGSWRFRLDADDAGIRQQWFQQELPDRIELPGCLQQGYGDKPSLATDWTTGIGKKLLEDPRFADYVRDEDFRSPFWLTLRVDNRVTIPVGLDAHSVSDQTQGNWNGVAGQLQLRRTGKLWIEDVQLYPDVASLAEIDLIYGDEKCGPQWREISPVHQIYDDTMKRTEVFLASLSLQEQPGGRSESVTSSPFVGNWALELPDGGAGWLSIRQEREQLLGELLWGVGSARPIADLTVSGDQLAFERVNRGRASGGTAAQQQFRQTISARVEGDRLRLTAKESVGDAAVAERVTTFAGRRLPPLPPQPDLSRVRFGPPLVLFNGRDLTGWRLTNPAQKNGWRVEHDVLVNETPKRDFSPYGEYGNLRTDLEFEDFQLSVEFNVPQGGNSGIYLRGMYEAQVVDRDSTMQGIQGPGAIFGRIAPVKNAGQAGGLWQRYDLTLVDRHVTVVLNGQKVIDNQPVLGCTGGALSADETRPGPIYLQGDHTSVQFRNIILRPVEK